MSVAAGNRTLLDGWGWHLALLLALLLAALLGACTTNQAPPVTALPGEGEVDVLAVAAAQATAIIQQAQATALVVQAQAQATALVAEAAAVVTEAMGGDLEGQEEGKATEIAQATPETGETITPAVEGGWVEIIGVGFAAEGGFIIVNYKADPEIAEAFWPGQLAVTDEASGTIYNEVAVMPKIGPLISRPKIAGQVGYIMFVNPPPGLKPGSLVTVTLGKYTFEHLEIK